jgi:meso-butanediol dehydrogenase/(S,S)-butanediol dehydrogenase/diacetyl reductase
MVAISRTGGGQGRAAALLFARGGATVVGYDRRAHLVNGAQPEAAKQWIDEAVGQSGCLNFLYNNAASVDCAPIEVNDAETVDGNAQR